MSITTQNPKDQPDGFDPVAAEQRGLALRNDNRLAESAAVFLELVERIPQWENGGGAFNLAGVFEDLQQMENAKKYYELALCFDSENEIFLGAYSSFLYIFGLIDESIDAYLKLVIVARKRRQLPVMERALEGLRYLGSRYATKQALIESRLDQLDLGLGT